MAKDSNNIRHSATAIDNRTEGEQTATHLPGGKVAAPVRRTSLSPTASDLQRERDRGLPVWIRAPKCGPEHYSGFTRAKLYDLATRGRIRSVSIREPGMIKGVRLFHLESIFDFVESCEVAAK